MNKMSYSVQPNEIAGFIALLDAANFYAQEHAERRKWLEHFPELKKTRFEELVDYIRDESQSCGKALPLRRVIQMFLPEIHSLDNLKNHISKSRNPDIDSSKIGEMIDSVYPVYQKFYKSNEKTLHKTAMQATELLNKIAFEPLKQVSHFFNPEYQPTEKPIVVYMFPTAINGWRGQNFHTQKGDIPQEDQQWIALGADMMEGSRPIDVGNISSTIYHEKIHGIFHDSKADKTLRDFLKSGNKIVQTLRDFPELKRNPNVPAINEAEMMVNEALTSAFEGILNEEVRGKKKEILYENDVINTMAHKAIPLLRETLKTGKTFGPDFLKKFEKEFVTAVPEMLALKKEKILSSRLSNGSKDGQNDLRDETKISQVSTEKKLGVSYQSKNPSRL